MDTAENFHGKKPRHSPKSTHAEMKIDISKPLIKEIAAVGLATVVVGLVVSTLWMRASSGKWPSGGIQLSVAGSLFVTGALVHIIAEYMGVNKWYCKNGVACK